MKYKLRKITLFVLAYGGEADSDAVESILKNTGLLVRVEKAEAREFPITEEEFQLHDLNLKTAWLSPDTNILNQLLEG